MRVHATAFADRLKCGDLGVHGPDGRTTWSGGYSLKNFWSQAAGAP
jgi:hypothetical protein